MRAALTAEARTRVVSGVGARVTRRSLLAFAGASALLGACARARGVEGVLRVGFLANLTHAPFIAGLASGRFSEALGDVRIESRVFRAGPRVTEALLGGAIDIGVSGPAPLVLSHARHEGAFRILSGCASGGASFVVAQRSGIREPGDLRRKSLATPQIGSTQDIALRKYLRENGLATTDRGGDVSVTALGSADIRAQMMRGALDGAWIPEPWATRIVGETNATRLVDERDRWPERMFPTALVVARSAFVDARRDDADRLVAAVHAEIARVATVPASTEQEAYDEVKRLTTNAGPRGLFHDALTRVDFTTDPLPDGVAAFARDAYDLGLIPRTRCETLFA